ncbi:hypothetical protein BFP70_06775 [Thioclava sp. SK-1]|uniref:OmpA family protein n=1 Tax=Thioclava sp. SK-1 TaxID=1889770 RepID=UPI0008253315|nr:OmpA family protein [Thioclava sp. SK-1]OCX65838.1 hypothetical protein BFP70_06775 [Thioclava sp. SK-1]
MIRPRCVFVSKCLSLYALMLWPGTIWAQSFALTLPQEATISAQDSDPAASYRLLIGPFAPEGGLAVDLEGARSDTAWRLPSNQQTILQITAPLRAQLADAGFQTLYECDGMHCGGFDFRYELDLLPEPQMHVDLGDYHYLAARRGDEFAALTVSRSSNSGFVHLTTLFSHPIDTPDTSSPLAQPVASDPFAQTSQIGQTLEQDGSAALDDLVFDSGKATLEAKTYDSLSGLADYMAANPAARVALVGHTDTVGGLQVNITLSRARAQAVRQALIAQFAIAPDRITAEGAGWLAPRDTNLTEAGRQNNRRVEVVLTSTQS